MRSVAGVQEINGYAMYLSGFQTGFNSEAEGIYDIFEAFGPDPIVQALYAVEPWCAKNPDKTFAGIALSQLLRAKIRENVAPATK